MKKSILLTVGFYITINLFGQSQTDSLIRLGINNHDAGDYTKAIEFYKQALVLDPNNPDANYEIAYSYMLAKDYENSIKYSDLVISYDNKNALSAYLTKGSSLDYLGKTDESIKLFEKAIKKFGDNYLLYYNLGYDYYKGNNKEKAEKAFVNAIQTKSNHASSHLMLAQLLADQNKNVQSLLGLYYFLFIEPNTDRSKTAMNLLDKQFGGNVQKDKEILGELKDKKKKGLWWDFYVPFFYDLSNSDHMETFCYYITQSTRESSTDWLEKNNPKIVLFDQWLKNN